MIRAAVVAVALLAQADGAGQDSDRTAETGETATCIDLSAVTNRRAEDGRTIRFDLIGGKTYLNRLPGRCPGLQQSSRGFGTLAFEVYGSRICRGDRVRMIDPSSPGAVAGRNSIPCPLGDFVEVPRPDSR